MISLFYSSLLDVLIRGGCSPDHASIRLDHLYPVLISILLSHCSIWWCYSENLIMMYKPEKLKQFVFNKFQKNAVNILKSAKNLSQGRTFKNLSWTYSAWARHFNRWTLRAFLILAINKFNKCKCSQWQMQCIFSLYWDSSLVFISTFCQTSRSDTNPAPHLLTWISRYTITSSFQPHIPVSQ